MKIFCQFCNQKTEFIYPKDIFINKFECRCEKCHNIIPLLETNNLERLFSNWHAVAMAIGTLIGIISGRVFPGLFRWPKIIITVIFLILQFLFWYKIGPGVIVAIYNKKMKPKTKKTD